MSIRDRALRAFENELVKNLSFTFTTARRVDSEGNVHTVLRVWMRNNSNVVLRDIRGSIGPGEAVTFRYTTFHVEHLPPRRESEIAEIKATIVEPMHNRFAFDEMATVNVSGTVDLQGFRFKEQGRGLTYVAARIPQSEVEAKPALARRGARAEIDDVPTLELDWSRVAGDKRSA